MPRWNSPVVLLVVAIALNVVTVYVMTQWKKSPTAWNVYAVLIAATIVPVQFILAHLSQDEQFPIDVAIAMTIACVMATAVVVDWLDSQKPISWGAVRLYVVMVICALLAGVVKNRANADAVEGADEAGGFESPTQVTARVPAASPFSSLPRRGEGTGET